MDTQTQKKSSSEGWKVFLAESVAYGNAQTQENVKDIQDGWNVAHLGGDSGDGPRAG